MNSENDARTVEFAIERQELKYSAKKQRFDEDVERNQNSVWE